MGGEVATTMNDINQSSRKIADIIGVIDGIAFQTSILALNAVVEAARAGQQGRGFAPVASEVRRLARRRGGPRNEDADWCLGREGGVKRVGDITVAAVEQSDGIGEVNTAISQLDQMTQQNCALVEESAAAT